MLSTFVSRLTIPLKSISILVHCFCYALWYLLKTLVQVRLHTIALFWIFDFQSLVKFVHFIFFYQNIFWVIFVRSSTDKLLLNFEKNLKSFSENKLYESPEGSFENKDSKFDSISEIRDSKFNILINQWDER
jgi:hypothetical protein